MLINRAKEITTTTGTGAVSFDGAVSSFQAWAAAGATDGATYSYLITDGTAWELGRGVYSASAHTITRPGPGTDTTFASSTGALLDLDGSATIACVANVADFAIPSSGTGAAVALGVADIIDKMDAQVASLAATSAASIPAGGKIDEVINSGGMVSLLLYANTNNGSGSPVVGSTYTVPAGCVAVCIGGEADNAISNQSAFYAHRLWNATQAAVAMGFDGGSQNRADAWKIGFSGKVSNSTGGGAETFNYPVVGVAGDILECQAWTNGDGNYRVQCARYYLAICNASTGELLAIDNPPPSGSRVLLQDVTVTSTVAGVPLTAFNNAVYLSYEVEVIGSLTTTPPAFLVSTDGGTTFDTSNIYDYSATLWGANNYNSTDPAENAGFIHLAGWSNSSPGSICGNIKVCNPGDTLNYKQFISDFSTSASDGHNYRIACGGRYKSTSAINALQFISQGGGEVTGGRFRLYGTVA